MTNKYNFGGHIFKLHIRQEYRCENCGCFLYCEEHGYFFAIPADIYYKNHIEHYENIGNELSCNEIVIKSIIE